MNVFLAGATGFIGRHLTRALADAGHRVRVLARASSDVAWLPAGGVEVARGDVADYDTVLAAVSGCEVLYNLAVPRRTSAAAVHRAVNVGGVENVMRAAREAGAGHVVHCSTAAVYGRLRRIPADEEHSLDPRGDYALTKLEGERVVLRHVREEGASSVIARLPWVYGPGDGKALDMFRRVLSGRLVTIGAARQLHHLTYVEDVVGGLLLCGSARGAKGEPYNLAAASPRPLADVFRAIAEVGGVTLRHRKLPALPLALLAAADAALLRPLSIGVPRLHGLVRRLDPQAYDIGKARRDLGYSPNVSLEEGVRRTLAWYRSVGALHAGEALSRSRHVIPRPSGVDT